MRRIFITLLLFISNSLSAETKKFETSDEPTYIKSDQLAVDNLKREFIYSGNVILTQSDLRLTSKTLEGKYDKDNKIQEIIAKGDVFITKGPSISASCQQANYDPNTAVVTLSKNPELTQNGSILLADTIRLFLNEDRSEADGEVRLRVPNEGNNQALRK